jgi:uncharacterized protein YabE (DUF348 family)
MLRLIHKKSVPFGIIVAGAILLFAAVWFFVSTRVSAQAMTPIGGQRLVTIHDRGREKSILTEATTLRQAFEEAGIYVDPSDLVEPSLDAQLMTTNYEVNIYRARPVTVIDGAVRQKVLSAYQTPKQIAQHAGVTLQDEDIAALAASDNMVADGAGIQMTITRATPFTLVLYGKKTQAYSQEKTVGDMLAKKGITLGTDDTLSVPHTMPLEKNMTIEIWRNGKQTVTEDQEITFPVEKIKDMDREVSYREVKTPGMPGKRSVTYEIEMRNGIEVGRIEIQSMVVKEPVKQVEIVGAKPSFSGDFAAALAKLRACESGGNYANKNNPLYRGAYQFSYSTWANKYGIYDPADATPVQQDQAARELYVRRGWQPWPHCGASLPDTYR